MIFFGKPGSTRRIKSEGMLFRIMLLAAAGRGRPFLARNGRAFQVNSGLAIDSIGFSALAEALCGRRRQLKRDRRRRGGQMRRAGS
jgi:hypothetical protein